MNETPEFPFWGLNICVDFDLSKKTENMKKLNNNPLYIMNSSFEKVIEYVLLLGVNL